MFVRSVTGITQLHSIASVFDSATAPKREVVRTLSVIAKQPARLAPVICKFDAPLGAAEDPCCFEHVTTLETIPTIPTIQTVCGVGGAGAAAAVERGGRLLSGGADPIAAGRGAPFSHRGRRHRRRRRGRPRHVAGNNGRTVIKPVSSRSATG
eukprot:702801-Prorocentrum_minimum.AAC.6